MARGRRGAAAGGGGRQRAGAGAGAAGVGCPMWSQGSRDRVRGCGRARVMARVCWRARRGSAGARRAPAANAFLPCSIWTCQNPGCPRPDWRPPPVIDRPAPLEGGSSRIPGPRPNTGYPSPPPRHRPAPLRLPHQIPRRKGPSSSECTKFRLSLPGSTTLGPRSPDSSQQRTRDAGITETAAAIPDSTPSLGAALLKPSVASGCSACPHCRPPERTDNRENEPAPCQPLTGRAVPKSRRCPETPSPTPPSPSTAERTDLSAQEPPLPRHRPICHSRWYEALFPRPSIPTTLTCLPLPVPGTCAPGDTDSCSP